MSFRILSERGLVFVRYTGFARLDESFEVFGQYAAHPDFRPGQKQLVDLSGVTGLEKDYVKLFALQARKADVFLGSGAQTLLDYYAPTPLSLDLAETILRSWEPSGAVIPLIQQDEQEALQLLGQPERSFEELLQAAR
ncbi:hypothetical protein [Nioella aestuarii]|uniref:hypothetical protein n=1 Tax=Nioella aestuarii TaxID=1662864 RepID=UPI003D7F9DE2